MRLLINTHYDYEKDASLLDIFRAQMYEGIEENGSMTKNIDSEVASIGFKMPQFQGGM
jgi:hypothetical protein